MLKKISGALWAIAGLGVMALGGSFFLVALGQPTFRSVPIVIGDRSKPVDKSGGAKGLLERLNVLPPMPSDALPATLLSATAPAVASSNPTGRMRALLYVGGVDRAEVFVDGQALGHTPYVGNISCEPNKPLKVELLPQKGGPLVFDRHCISEIRVEP